MSVITLRNVPPWDGEYEFDRDRSFTTHELRWIKQIAGYLPASLQQGLEGGDADLVIAIIVIAMQRAGRISRDEVLAVADRLADEPVSDDEDSFVTIDYRDEVVEDEIPPAPPLEHEPSSPSLSSERASSSGPPSPSTTASQGETPEPTGLGRLPTSVAYSPRGSAT